MAPRWRKVGRDMWGNKTRTLLVVISIAVGVFAVGLIASTAIILSGQLTSSYLAVNPAHAIFAASAFDDDLVTTIERMPEVAAADGRSSFFLRVQTSTGEWRDFTMYAIPDYEDQHINIVKPETGAWPPPLEEVVIERNSLPLLEGLRVGDTLRMEMPDGELRDVRIAGQAHDINLPPARFVNRTYGYVTFDSLEKWGLPRDYAQLSILVADRPFDIEHIKDVASLVEDKIKKGGLQVFFSYVPTPGKHPADEVLPAVFLLLGVLGALSLFLSSFLVINTISAILSQQTPQIGIMKTIGARSSQVMAMYIGQVMVFGLLALVIAVPLSAVGAYAFAGFLANLINFDIVNEGIPTQVLLIQIAAALLVPLLAALYPILNGAHITVREAISHYGLGQGRFGRSNFDTLMVRMQTRLPFISRPLLLSLRNTFRRRGRLALTMITLTLGGAIFVSVFSVRLSIANTLDDAANYFNFDVYVGFDRAYRSEQLQLEAFQLPGVAAVEAWGDGSARRQRPDGSESDRIELQAPPADTTMIEPNLLQGRWLLPEDENAVVINSSVLDDEKDIGVGDEMVLRINERDTTFQVVGIAQSYLIPSTAWINYPYFARLTGQAGRAGFVRISIDPDDPDSQKRTAEALEKHFEAAGYQVNLIGTIATDLEAVHFQFSILVLLLLVMAILMAIVGGLGLMGTMSINVLERTREIGVLRAIGASTPAVMQIVVVEGVLIGLISWLQGVILAYPISKLLADQVGLAFVDAPLSYGYSLTGALVWLIVATVLAAVSSYLPARTASRLTVREVLAYE